MFQIGLDKLVPQDVISPSLIILILKPAYTFVFENDRSGTKKKIYLVYGDRALNCQTCQKCIEKFFLTSYFENDQIKTCPENRQHAG